MQNKDPDTRRMIQQFIQIASQDSLSFHEGKTASLLRIMLQDLGFTVYEDDASSQLNAETGNLYASFPGTRKDRRPVLFSAHMDTVSPGKGKKPTLHDDTGILTSAGDTVLGADDICGILEILEGVRLAQSDPEGCGDIEILFTAAEEAYAKGSQVFDFSRIRSEDAYVLDMSGPPGTAARMAPSILSFTAEIKGKASHAGFLPQCGINALQAAASAISRLRQGQITDKTTFNIGTIHGGTADNIVPESCICTGECRSFSHEEALRTTAEAADVFRSAAAEIGASVDFQQTVQIQAYETPETAAVCRDFQNACQKIGLPGELVSTHGGSDNNVFAQKGINGIVLSCGMYQTHSTREFARVEDLAKGAALVSAIISERGIEKNDHNKGY